MANTHLFMETKITTYILFMSVYTFDSLSCEIQTCHYIQPIFHLYYQRDADVASDLHLTPMKLQSQFLHLHLTNLATA